MHWSARGVRSISRSSEFISGTDRLVGQRRTRVLRGVIPDQAALHGVLAEIEALGLELLESGASSAVV